MDAPLANPSCDGSSLLHAKTRGIIADQHTPVERPGGHIRQQRTG
jgi:hypothetical protein